MSRINNLTGPRVQVPTPQANAASSRAGFGSVLQQHNQNMMSAANRPGDPLMSTGGLVVQSALNSVGGSSHGGLLNSYLSAVGRPPIAKDASSADGAQAASTPAAGSKEAEEQKVMMELAELSAATLNNSIFHMGNRMKVSLERE